MKLNDLFGGVEKFLQEIKQKSKKITTTALVLTQLNPIIIPTILPATQAINPLTLLVPEQSITEVVENKETIEAPKIILSLTSENIVEISEDDGFKVKKVESRAEAKARRAKAEAAKKRQQELARKAAQEREQKLRIASTTAPSGNCEAYRGLVAKYFPSSQVNNALLTMKRESGCRPNAVSATNDHGLMQINYRWHAGKVGGVKSRLYDPETNIRIAAGIYQGRGWSAWYAVRGILW